MGDPIKLVEDEQALADGIRQNLGVVRQHIRNREVTDEDRQLLAQVGADAHALHMALLNRDPELEPRHHRYMLKNRGMSPRDPRFYEHVHPAEDLLKFLDDPSANEDPVDQTIGAEFDFSVYSRRWGHEDSYRITRTEDGWFVKHAGIGGPCDKQGKPYLFKNLSQDHINYPAALPNYLERVWDEASNEGSGLTKHQVQRALNRLAKWVSETERGTPDLTKDFK